ncbi:putative neprosin [Helianthus debilis subsp. tardiflorus]
MWRSNIFIQVPELPKRHAKAGRNSEIKQLWNSKGESCPNGTIPIKRTSASDISIFKSAKKYTSRKDLVSANYEHATGYVQGEFYGANAYLNVWKPYVTSNDFSRSQIWVLSYVGANLANSVEAGWQVYINENKDIRPRLFIFWTADGYQSGCYNLVCSGFVQTNQKISLGSAIDPISTYNGEQYGFAFMIWKEPKCGDWWLKVGTEVIGYWPNSLFTGLQGNATTIEYGGEVYSHDLADNHTATQMGSGHFPDEDFKKAAFVRKLAVIDQHNELKPVSNLNLFATRPNCYGVKKGRGNPDIWGDYIFFGGPGYNPDCP